MTINDKIYLLDQAVIDLPEHLVNQIFKETAPSSCGAAPVPDPPADQVEHI